VSGTLQRQAWLDRVLPPVELVRPGLWSIPTPYPNSPLRYVLAYAIEYAGGIALVDTGWPAEAAWDGLLAGLAEAGWGLADIRAILVTHGHGDHMGLVKRLREHTGAWVAMHEADVTRRGLWASQADFNQAVADSLLARGAQPEDFGAVRTGAPRGDFFAELAIEPDRFLVDGERPLGPGTGLVNVWTPGHTPGHVCFFDDDRNVLLTGDHILPRITPNISHAPRETGDILGRYLESLRAVAGIAAEEVLPAHEYRFIGLAGRVEGLLAHHGERLGEVLAAVAAAPGCTTVTVAAALHWSRPWEQMLGLPRRFAIGEAYSHLVHLAATGRVVNKGAAVDAWHVA
jgi:glyoxylase-like metal-dependent hydrolase (beta-lactamase superfamily II)